MTPTLNAPGQPVGAPLDLPLPRPRPDDRRLQGQHCALVRLDPGVHGPGLFQAFRSDTDNRGWTYLPYGPFSDPDAFADWLQRICAGRDPLFYCIQTPQGVPLGMAAYLRITPDTGTIEIGHVHYAPELRRTAMATEAISLMLGYAFDTLRYRRCEWKCDALNAASRRAATRLGFTLEGIFRKASVVKGRNRDTAWFSMIDDEWPARKQALTAWLAPGNFSGDGRQIQPLAQWTPPAD